MDKTKRNPDEESSEDIINWGSPINRTAESVTDSSCSTKMGGVSKSLAKSLDFLDDDEEFTIGKTNEFSSPEAVSPEVVNKQPVSIYTESEIKNTPDFSSAEKTRNFTDFLSSESEEFEIPQRATFKKEQENKKSPEVNTKQLNEPVESADYNEFKDNILETTKHDSIQQENVIQQENSYCSENQQIIYNNEESEHVSHPMINRNGPSKTTKFESTNTIKFAGNKILRHFMKTSKRVSGNTIVDKPIWIFELHQLAIPVVTENSFKDKTALKIAELHIKSNHCKDDYLKIKSILNLHDEAIFNHDLVISIEKDELNTMLTNRNMLFSSQEEIFNYIAVCSNFNPLETSIIRHKMGLPCCFADAKLSPHLLNEVLSINIPELTLEFIKQQQSNRVVYLIIFYKLGMMDARSLEPFYSKNIFYRFLLAKAGMSSAKTVKEGKSGWNVRSIVDFGISKILNVEKANHHTSPLESIVADAIQQHATSTLTTKSNSVENSHTTTISSISGNCSSNNEFGIIHPTANKSTFSTDISQFRSTAVFTNGNEASNTNYQEQYFNTNDQEHFSNKNVQKHQLSTNQDLSSCAKQSSKKFIFDESDDEDFFPAENLTKSENYNEISEQQISADNSVVDLRVHDDIVGLIQEDETHDLKETDDVASFIDEQSCAFPENESTPATVSIETSETGNEINPVDDTTSTNHPDNYTNATADDDRVIYEQSNLQQDVSTEYETSLDQRPDPQEKGDFPSVAPITYQSPLDQRTDLQDKKNLSADNNEISEIHQSDNSLTPELPKDEKNQLYKKKFSKSFADIFDVGGEASAPSNVDLSSYVPDVSESDKPISMTESTDTKGSVLSSIFGIFKKKPVEPTKPKPNIMQERMSRPLKAELQAPEKKERTVIQSSYANMKNTDNVEIPGFKPIRKKD